jgi:hypothetical protein
VERLRGLHLDGAAMDEFPLLNQQAFSSIVRPALADYHGWAAVAGTPMGDANAFYQLKLIAEKDPENWEVFDIPISATAEDALTRDEVEALRYIEGELSAIFPHGGTIKLYGACRGCTLCNTLDIAIPDLWLRRKMGRYKRISAAVAVFCC